mmetsp:Transcript_27173/g.42494  ORF Transcript_27173/g.42494 Transcript_27173/m.42494 type:complete len:136 (-) Transcript_27173:25-432(-)
MSKRSFSIGKSFSFGFGSRKVEEKTGPSNGSPAVKTGQASGAKGPSKSEFTASTSAKQDKKILVEKGQEQYELTYEQAKWNEAREATVRLERNNAASVPYQRVYGSEEEIQNEYQRRFGPPKSTFIGKAEDLMAV